MKNTILAIAFLFFAFSATAQEDTLITKATTSTAQVELPEHLKGVTSETVRPEHFLPVLGIYQASENSTGTLTVTVDESNVGIVWIEGLPQGRVKALLKKSPATYKIPAQKTAEGKSVSEGILYYDPATKEVKVLIGRTFNDAEPLSVFSTTTKSKSGYSFTGTKANAVVATETQMDQQ